MYLQVISWNCIIYTYYMYFVIKYYIKLKNLKRLLVEFCEVPKSPFKLTDFAEDLL